jgi:hypothetical protein
MTDDDFRRLVLAFPETTEGRHGELPTFHVRGRRFATLAWPEPGKVSIALSLEEQELLHQTCPHAFERAQGWSGRQGHSYLNLKAADEATIRSVITMAWRRSAPASLARSLAAEWASSPYKP